MSSPRTPSLRREFVGAQIQTIRARRPAEVAREVEQHAKRGAKSFLISRIDNGGMLDRERLGAARYAAGLHSEVELDPETPAALAAAR